MRRYYASLSDDELLAIERGDLTEAAQGCYDQEIGKRNIAFPEESLEEAVGEDEPIESDWLETASCACSFGDSDSSELAQACKLLEEAGVAYHVNTTQDNPQTDNPYFTHQVMVPAAQQLLAMSVLDLGLFNPQQESDWKAHFEELSEEEFRTLNIDDLTAGMADRIQRLKRVYLDEQARRSG